MPSLTSAMEIAKSSLRTQQLGLNVTGNNIANVNTPGYVRKSANLTSSYTLNGIGSGVRMGSLTAVRDRMLDSQARFESSLLGRLEALASGMSTMEAIFTEMSGGGATEPGAVFNESSGAALSGAFSRFFNAFQDMANNPESQAGRAAVREEAIFMVEQFHRITEHLSVLREDTEQEFRYAVEEANRYTEAIATLNVKIVSQKDQSTDVAGDLEDERGRLLDELSKLIDIRIREEDNGSLTVQAPGGALLVSLGDANQLGIRAVSRDGAVVSDLTLADTGTAVKPTTGRLVGLMEVRDQKVVSFQSDVDALASSFVTRINGIHAGGYGLDGSTGNDFFDPAGTTARQITVSDAVMGDLNTIAASTAATLTGDGSNALALSGIRSEMLMNGGTQTIEEYYSDTIGRVGAEAKGVFIDAEGQKLVMNQISTRRENVRGVSINEEATSLILFQRAYQAAARIVTIVDEMMQTVLNI